MVKHLERVRKAGMVVSAAMVFSWLTGCSAQNSNEAHQHDERWISLFDGESLAGWTPKFKGQPLGENYLDTFGVRDGVLTVSYDHYGDFGGEFGHLFYAQPYSHYIVRAEYRFVGEQVAQAPAWARANNGLMLHSQAPETMALEQDFPTSIEVQLLGAAEGETRSTGNLCTPGTHVMMDGQLRTEHCINSASASYEGDQWVVAEVEVHGADLMIHRINGEEVMRYGPLVYEEQVAESLGIASQPALIGSGYIAIQAESAPTEFRRIELKVLEP